MQFYNALTKKVQPFHPLTAKTARIYSCGPTVYNHAHIGNLSAYVFADTLHRVIKHSGFNVRHVMNYTDVDDKTIRRSREQYPNDEPMAALRRLTDHYIDIFNADAAAIGIDLDALHFIRATDVIEEIKTLISALHADGFAYIADDGVYFSIEAYRKSGKNYGQLLTISAQNTSAARINNDEYDKESAHDFALWKTQKPDEPAWDFTLDGHNLTGRPGWHIECSVMSQLKLGQPFDIHTGGVDLIFPHHENEIAQSTALEESPVMAQFFMHNDHLLVDGKKMAKSAQNFFTLQDVRAKGFDPLAFRLLILQAHYRSQTNFTWETLTAAQNRLNGLRAMADLRFQTRQNGTDQIADYAAYQKDIEQAMQNDLDTPAALAVLSAAEADSTEPIADQDGNPAQFTAFLETVDALLGLQLLGSKDITDKQKDLVVQREQARAQKNWELSDSLRDQLAEQGIGLRDTTRGAVWYRL